MLDTLKNLFLRIKKDHGSPIYYCLDSAQAISLCLVGENLANFQFVSLIHSESWEDQRLMSTQCQISSHANLRSEFWREVNV